MAESRYSIVLIAAVVTAGAATYGVYRVIETTKAEARSLLRPVVVANVDLPEGAALDQSSLAVAQWPMATVPPGAFPSVDSLVGRVTRIAVFKGEPIIPGRLAPSGTGPGIQVKINPGKRAMAVKIDDVAGISGLMQPNSRVDVLVTLREQEANGVQVAKFFMSNMRVLAVGTVVQSGPDNRPINATTATLEVTPEESERLAVAMREGSIQLVLRGYGDPDSISTTGARSEDVLSQLRSARAVRIPERPTQRSRASAPRSTRVDTVVMQAPVVERVVESAPARPDSVAITIYRGEKSTSQKFAKTDTTKKKPGQP
ncbi:MAG TPA: Flp pilus assembly protein CpaB [Gemmatimonadaceae bacterium]|nr:Flp pilus assembly protein CpaB [Gemmatimonadaceae bacterium]